MAVIKANSAGSLVHEAIVLDLGDLRRQADQLRESARQEAAQIIAQAQAHAKELVAGAHEKGYAQGLDEGRKAGHAAGLESGRAAALAQAQPMLQQLERTWKAALESLDQQRAAYEREARIAVLELALALAEHVVHRSVQVDPHIVEHQFEAALRHVLRPCEVTVRIHPQDRAVLQEALPRLLASFSQVKHVELVEDAAAGVGGCVVSFGKGVIDATVHTQLRRLAQMMMPGTEVLQANKSLPDAQDPASDVSGDAGAQRGETP